LLEGLGVDRRLREELSWMGESRASMKVGGKRVQEATKLQDCAD
jgi:hypothetical protein